MCDMCDGMTETEYWSRLFRAISEQGWFLQAVEGGDDRNPPFAYTIGLTLYGHPEIITFGMHSECAHAAIAPLAQRVPAGRRFDEGDDVSDLFGSTEPARLLRFPDSSTHLFRANELFRHDGEPPVPALQLFWPSEEPLLRRSA